MPIQFRCGACSKLLGIATRKAGTDIACPHCATLITVPRLNSNTDGATEPIDLSEIDELLNESEVQPLSPAPAPTPPARPSRPIPAPIPAESERNVELVVMPPKPAVVPLPAPPPPRPTPRQEVPRQGDLTGHVVISYTKITVFVIAVAVMLFLAFVTGYRMAARP